MSRDSNPESPRPTRLLIVEDDERISSALEHALTMRNYQTSVVATGREALETDVTDHVDLILLDLGLPDMDGLEVCRQIRQISDIPIIAVTARGESPQRVAGLRTGVDDYLVKPFSLAELSARIDAVLRRTGRTDDVLERLKFGPLVIDQAAHTVEVGGQEVQLTRKEYDLLVLFAQRPGTVLSRADILEQVWHTTWVGKSRTVDVHVAVLRQKLGIPELIRTVHGVGYQLVDD